jgi:hypothetical protein
MGGVRNAPNAQNVQRKAQQSGRHACETSDRPISGMPNVMGAYTEGGEVDGGALLMWRPWVV